MYEIENSRIVPSKHLADMLRNSIEGNDFFSYDEAQASAVSEIVRTVEDAIYYNEKKTIIIKGGAGTGKSVVAINVLGQLVSGKHGAKYNAAYFTTNAAPRVLYTEELIKDDYTKKAIKNLFKYPTIFKSAGENDFDCAIIDAYGIIGLNSKGSANKGFLKLSPILFSPQMRLMIDLRRKHAQNEDLSAKRSAACNSGSTVSDVVPSRLLQRQSAEHTPDVDLHRSTVRYSKDVSLACAA